MSREVISFHQEEFVGIITLNRPEQGHAVNARMAAELKEIAAEIDYDSNIRVLVLTGAGSIFCLGTDPTEKVDYAGRNELALQLAAASTIAAINRPVIAAINGNALGQGLEIALACDLRLASAEAVFGLPQVTGNEIPWDGGTQRLPRIIGRTRAMEMILLGRTIDAPEALKAGLVSRIITPENLMSETMSLARELAEKAPFAVRLAKEAVWKGMDMTLDQGLRLEADLYFLLHTTKDRTEGIEAFRAKRPPRFTGQ